MITKNDMAYPTIADAAEEFGVSAKTVRDWIEKGIITEPPTFDHGVRTIAYFPPEYMEKAKKQLKDYREHKERKNRKDKHKRLNKQKPKYL